MTTDSERDLSAVEIAKLEGRMDAGFAEVGGKLDTLIAKQDAAESKRADDRATADARYLDHENRLRALESRRTITPRELWGVVSGAAGIAIAVVALFF